MMKKLLLALVANLLLTLMAAAASPVWVVSTDHSTTYLAGTCHVLRPADYPLPAAFAEAYAASATVVFETDPGQLAAAEFQQQIMAQGVYRDDRSLEDVLSPATFAALQQYCRQAGIPVAAVSRLRPSLAALTLLGLELQRQGVTESGVDFHFYDRATGDHKGIGSLETAAEQIAYLLALGEGDEDVFIRHALQDLARTGELFAELIPIWRRGDVPALERLLLKDLRDEFPAIYRTLLTERNARWLPALTEMIESPQTELVLVGAAHLVGPDGLLAALQKRGYKLRQLP